MYRVKEENDFESVPEIVLPSLEVARLHAAQRAVSIADETCGIASTFSPDVYYIWLGGHIVARLRVEAVGDGA